MSKEFYRVVFEVFEFSSTFLFEGYRGTDMRGFVAYFFLEFSKKSLCKSVNTWPSYGRYKNFGVM